MPLDEARNGSADAGIPPEFVDVWSGALECTPEQSREWEASLAFDEKSRRDRFLFETGRRRFAAARAMLRQLLGRYTGLPPQDLCFAYGDNGKPSLASPCSPATLQFNMSHSCELALFAVTLAREVGVDVEFVRTDVPVEELAKHCFSAREQEAFGALPPERRRDAFFRTWVRKEAYLKARGAGLSAPLAEFDVTVDPDGHPQLLADRIHPGGNWIMRDFTPAPGYVGALVVEGTRCTFRWCGEIKT